MTGKAKSLLAKYAAGQCTPEEAAIVESWYLQHQQEETADLADAERLADMQEIRNQLLGEINQRRSKPHRMWLRIAAAASVLLFLSIGSYYMLHRQQPRQNAYHQHDIAPGRNQATLTLANGQKIILTKGLSGKLARQGQTTIQVNHGHAITYTAGQQGAQVSYNTLTTARGEQSPYPLVLADGSRVWLNAASSITFPTAFTGKERLVKLSGEAYVEVAHNAAQPFRVKVNGQMIEDIGTSFNINAYADEPVIKTTLLEGAIKLTAADGHTVRLRPGEQALSNGNDTRVALIDMEPVIAWKNGDFMFKNENLAAVMRQVARWYNVDIVYDASAPSEHIPFGMVSRAKNISAVLKIMETTGKIHFKVEGRRVIVTR